MRGFRTCAVHVLRAPSALGISAVGRGFNVGCDALPRKSRSAIRGQVPYQLAHVGERLQRHDIGDGERLWQRTRPIRAGREDLSLRNVASTKYN